MAGCGGMLRRSFAPCRRSVRAFVNNAGMPKKARIEKQSGRESPFFRERRSEQFCLSPVIA